MQKLPRIITTSVIRSARQGESHGGVYLVDLDSGDIEQAVDWNDRTINWEGRGGDRGLRGIAFHQGKIYLAASDEIFVYDPRFKLLESFTNRYLKRCHEINIANNILYLTSTDLNSVLEFDLTRRLFIRGYTIARAQPGKGNLVGRIRAAASRRAKFRVTLFDPNSKNGPTETPNSSDLHINNVSHINESLMISGTRIQALLALKEETLQEYAPLPRGTHNASAYRDGVIYNDTASDRLVIANRNNRITQAFPTPKYDVAELSHADVPGDHARQGFARGLCLYGKDIVIGGSSPSTISAYSLASGQRIKQVIISKDIRNCIHGLELWPEESTHSTPSSSFFSK
jgi:hypothetical protein